ncbi:MAG: hypothetical protein ACOWWO_02660 [Peptococcaceae bacterium]
MFNGKIGVSKGFQNSINVGFDLNNDEKITSFIPTISSLGIIEDVLLSTNHNSQDRARILIGAYGKGKSHIILVLMALLFKKDITLFSKLLNKMKEYNEELYNFALDYLHSDKRLLPIIISGSSTSLTQSFLNALQQSLRTEGFNDLMPDTHFQAAIKAINRWKTDYSETYNRFIGTINEPINEFLLSLSEYNVSAYEKFEKLYPSLTSGSAFNPFIGFDVVELYIKVVEKLKDKGYDGVYVVYDEFSKYLESSITKASVSDIKMLQDFAEKCNRSAELQMHLMLISHKDISNYIDKLPRQKVDGWQGISGRFKHITLHNNFSQIYEIISAVIKKDEDYWEEYCKLNQRRFDDIKDRFKANGIFDKNDADIAIKDCYPLHPISTFILPRLSEKVAQNERTLFTFLSSDHKYTLSAFLRSAEGDFPMLTPDYIYDYFEPLFRKEIYTSEVHKLFKLTSNILNRLNDDSFGVKIIKTIALIYIVEQFEKLPPTVDIIVAAFKEYAESTQEIEKTLSELIEKQYVIYLKQSNNYLKLKESSGVDIQKAITDTIEKTRSTLSVKEILNQSSFDSYMYPTSYNDDKEIIRYFDFAFIDSAEFFAVQNWDKKIENFKSDGVVYAIIPESEEEIESIKSCIAKENTKHNRIIFVVPNNYVNIEKIAFEYSAVKMLKSVVDEDELLLDEYDIYIEDLEEVIGSFIRCYTRPETNGAEYYYMGERQLLYRKAQFSALLSTICENTYPLTPIVNNESINKDTLPTVAINSRNKVVAGLLENELEINLGLTGTGQDVSIMRSTLIRTGILNNETEPPTLNLTPDDNNMRNLLETISNFIAGANNNTGQNLGILYDKLILPEHGIGMKKGIIPIYIAVALHHFKKYVVIKNKNVEVKITVDLLNSINEIPRNYTIFLEDWNEEKAEYINRLAELFADHIIEKEKDYNTFSYIVLAMGRWYMGLPKYAKEMKRIYNGKDFDHSYQPIDAQKIKFLNSLKQQNINAREYLFEKVFEIYNYHEFTCAVIDNITVAKQLFDSAKNSLVKALITDVKSIFNISNIKGASLTSIIKDWYESLKDTTVNHLYLNGEEKVLQLISTISNDEKTFIERLAKAVTGLRVDDWNTDTIAAFVDSLIAFKKTVEDFEKDTKADLTSNTTGIYKLSFIDRSGREVVKTFSKTEYSNTAKLLLNEINTALEEMGHAITEHEKRQVLMELLEKMC